MHVFAGTSFGKAKEETIRQCLLEIDVSSYANNMPNFNVIICPKDRKRKTCRRKQSILVLKSKKSDQKGKVEGEFQGPRSNVR